MTFGENWGRGHRRKSANRCSINAAQIARLDAASPIELAFPHDFLSSGNVRDMVFAGIFDHIDNHRA
jgi:hypothetical protein